MPCPTLSHSLTYPMLTVALYSNLDQKIIGTLVMRMVSLCLTEHPVGFELATFRFFCNAYTFYKRSKIGKTFVLPGRQFILKHWRCFVVPTELNEAKFMTLLQYDWEDYCIWSISVWVGLLVSMASYVKQKHALLYQKVH